MNHETYSNPMEDRAKIRREYLLRRDAMNLAHSALLEDAARKRQEYLWKKVAAGAGVVLFAVGTLFAILCCLLSLLYRQQSPWLSEWALFASMLAGAAGINSYLTYRIAKEAKSLPYVPPVREQIASFPADATLLRGSDQPTATGEELLRAAQAGKVESLEELLRPGPKGLAEEMPQSIARTKL